MANWAQFGHFHLGVCVLTFVASGLDINGCCVVVIMRRQQIYTVILQEGTLTTLQCIKVSFLPCCHMKIYNKICTKI